MAILRGSRYTGTNITAIRTADGKTIRYLNSRTFLRSQDIPGVFARQRISRGQEMDHLAQRFGGRERRWWLIAELNDVFYIHDPEPNDVLFIPPEKVFQDF